MRHRVSSRLLDGFDDSVGVPPTINRIPGEGGLEELLARDGSEPLWPPDLLPAPDPVNAEGARLAPRIARALQRGSWNATSCRTPAPSSFTKLTGLQVNAPDRSASPSLPELLGGCHSGSAGLQAAVDA